jgi:glycine hydroxymethyltransferase
LLALDMDKETRYRVRRLRRTEVLQGRLAGLDLIISRTGYTGERRCYELFVHPDQAVELWGALMAAGEPLGLLPVGLGARDSLRIEAGLPLYGHELAGPLDLGPGHAGFASYVKTYKPFFVGWRAYAAREKERDSVVARFRMLERGVRVPQQGDPIVSLKGRVVGKVTSCSIDTQGQLVGQAYIKRQHTQPGTVVAVFQSTRAWSSKPRHELNVGDRVQLHDRAVILNRFMQRK